MNGFKSTLGALAAVVLLFGFGLGGYVGWQHHRAANQTVQDIKIHAADTTAKHLTVARHTEQAALATENKHLKRLLAENQQASAAARDTLQSLQGVIDSVSHLPKDSAVIDSTTIPATLAYELVARQWGVDSLVIAQRDSALSVQGDILRTTNAEIVTADSTAQTWKDKFTAERKKTPSKWKGIALKAGASVGIAILTHLVFK